MSWFRRTFRAEAEAILARGRAASEVQHPGVKGDVAERLIAHFLDTTLPDRFGVGTGIIVGSGATQSGQIDIIVYDESLPSSPSQVDAVGAEAVYATVEVKTRIERRHIPKAMRDAHTIKGLPRRASRMRFAAPESATLADVSLHAPPLTQCTVVALSSKFSLLSLAQFWHHHFLDVPFGAGLDGVLVLDSGHVGLGSWLPQSGDPLNTVSPLYNLAPGDKDASSDRAVLLLPDIFARNWKAEYPVRVGPRVSLAVGSRLYITVNECGLDALGIWFRMLWGFISSQLQIRGDAILDSLGGFEEAFPSREIDAVFPLAIAADPVTLENSGAEYAVDMVHSLLSQAG
jgi:hypothetical protein